jgi:hypothetical protein
MSEAEREEVAAVMETMAANDRDGSSGNDNDGSSGNSIDRGSGGI